MNKLVLKTFLMVVVNGKAYTSGLQATAVQQLVKLGVVAQGSDTFGGYITLHALGIERALQILAQPDRPQLAKVLYLNDPTLGRD